MFVFLANVLLLLSLHSQAGEFLSADGYLTVHPLKPFAIKDLRLPEMFATGLLNIGEDVENNRGKIEMFNGLFARNLLSFNEFLSKANNPRPIEWIKTKEKKILHEAKALDFVRSQCLVIKDPIACFLMGHVYRYGWYGEEINHSEAKKNYERSAELGYLVAKHMIAQWCLGMGDQEYHENNADKALLYLKDASLGGYEKSQALMLKLILNKDNNIPIDEKVDYILKSIENEFQWYEFVRTIIEEKSEANEKLSVARRNRPQRAGAPMGGGNGGILAAVVAVSLVATAEVLASHNTAEQEYKCALEKANLAYAKLNAHRTEYGRFQELEHLVHLPLEKSENWVTLFKENVKKLYQEIPVHNIVALDGHALNTQEITETATRAADNYSMLVSHSSALIIVQKTWIERLAPIFNRFVYNQLNPEENAFFELYELPDGRVAISLGKEAIQKSRQFIASLNDAAQLTMLSGDDLKLFTNHVMELVAGLAPYKRASVMRQSPTLYQVVNAH